MTPELAELLGILAGDGCLSRSGRKYMVYICGHKTDDYEYHLKTTRKLFLETFEKDTRIQFRTNEQTLFIRFSDKKIFGYLSQFMPIGKKYDAMRIPYQILASPYITDYIRGLFDTDGCVVFSKQHQEVPYYPRLEITNKSHPFLSQIRAALSAYSLTGSLSSKGRGYRLEIAGFQKLSLWMEHIGIHNPKHMKKLRNVYKQPKNLKTSQLPS